MDQEQTVAQHVDPLHSSEIDQHGPALGGAGTGHRIVVEPRPGGDDDLRLQRLLALGFLVPGPAAACLGLFGFGRLQVSWALSVADDCDVVTIGRPGRRTGSRSEEHTSELQSLMRISYAVFCLKKKKKHTMTT